MFALASRQNSTKFGGTFGSLIRINLTHIYGDCVSYDDITVMYNSLEADNRMIDVI